MGHRGRREMREQLVSGCSLGAALSRNTEVISRRNSCRS
ncbi:rCG61287 [Rattus norvegicus]|uniref:RCG61287 n=1 Tax=Rattus norvegicus TaxID=10116 RepID=A6KE64_RAT|nr:rCG61287 [Rattus norvegicus]